MKDGYEHPICVYCKRRIDTEDTGKEMKLDCAECGETLTVLHDCKPKEEERLREILSCHSDCRNELVASILKEFKLRKE